MRRSASNFNGPGGVQSIINANLHQTDIGIRRDTAAFEYRWTPTDAWDIKADYSHMHREGTQAMGVVFNNSTSGIVAEAPAPVNDTTQNFGVNGEYAGTSPWGKKFNVKLAYNGSVYQRRQFFRHRQSVLQTGRLRAEAIRPSPTPATRQTAFRHLAGVALSGQQRQCRLPARPASICRGRAATWALLSYTMMRQDDAFLPFTTNALLNPPGRILINGQPATSLLRCRLRA